MRSFLLIITTLIFFACNNPTGKDAYATAKAATDSSNFTSVQWLDSLQNIGKLNFGEVAQVKFHFKNTGDKPLFIIAAEPGCGCTVADFPKGAIGKGEEGEIVAAFDTKKGSVGGFKKGINIRTNTQEGSAMVFFEGEIVSKDGKGERPEPVQTQ